MTKRTEIDQLKHDYFMLSLRIVGQEKSVAELRSEVDRLKPVPLPLISVEVSTDTGWHPMTPNELARSQRLVDQRNKERNHVD